MMPTNEAETIKLFESVQNRLGWRIVELQQAFPDAVIENGEGTRLIAEFEYKAANFRIHGHDPSGCHIIICWHNNWPASPLPIWALKDWLPIVDPTWPDIAAWRPDNTPICYGSFLKLRTLLDGAYKRLKRTEKELWEARLKLSCQRKIDRAGIFEIRGVGQLSIESGQDFQRFGRFFREIFSTQPVTDIQDKWIRRHEIMRHLVANGSVTGVLTELIDALSEY